MPGTVGLNVEVLETVLAQGASDAQRVMLRAIPGAAFFVFDRDIRFVFAEGEALRESGRDPQRDVEGRGFEEMLGPLAEQLLDAYRTAIAGRPVELDVRAGDRTHWVHAAPILDEHGAVVAGLSISIDVTEQRRCRGRPAAPRPRAVGDRRARPPRARRREPRAAAEIRGRRGRGHPRRRPGERHPPRRGVRTSGACRRGRLAGGGDPPDPTADHRRASPGSRGAQRRSRDPPRCLAARAGRSDDRVDGRREHDHRARSEARIGRMAR